MKQNLREGSPEIKNLFVRLAFGLIRKFIFRRIKKENTEAINIADASIASVEEAVVILTDDNPDNEQQFKELLNEKRDGMFHLSSKFMQGKIAASDLSNPMKDFLTRRVETLEKTVVILTDENPDNAKQLRTLLREESAGEIAYIDEHLKGLLGNIEDPETREATEEMLAVVMETLSAEAGRLPE